MCVCVCVSACVSMCECVRVCVRPCILNVASLHASCRRRRRSQRRRRLHVRPGDGRWRRLLGLQRIWGSGDGRHDQQTHPDGGGWARSRWVRRCNL